MLHTFDVTESERKALERHLKDIRETNRCPYEKIKSLYHETLIDHPKIRKLTTTRKKHINARWKSDLETCDDWYQYFQYVKTSGFLTGRDKGFGGNYFKADFDFLIRESTVIKVQEGKYHGVRANQSSREAGRENKQNESVQRWWVPS